MKAPEPPPGSVIGWSVQLSEGGRWYNYVAIHAGGKGWYVSDRSTLPFTWEELCRLYLDAADKVSLVTGWTRVE